MVGFPSVSIRLSGAIHLMGFLSFTLATELLSFPWSLRSGPKPVTLATIRWTTVFSRTFLAASRRCSICKFPLVGSSQFSYGKYYVQNRFILRKYQQQYRQVLLTKDEYCTTVLSLCFILHINIILLFSLTWLTIMNICFHFKQVSLKHRLTIHCRTPALWSSSRPLAMWMEKSIMASSVSGETSMLACLVSHSFRLSSHSSKTNIGPSGTVVIW